MFSKMTYKKYKRFTILAFLLFPLLYHFFNTYKYAYGEYDGKHCAGLLDATWECTQFEYYVDFMTNIFALTSLAMSYFVAFVLFLAMMFLGRIYFHRTEKK